MKTFIIKRDSWHYKLVKFADMEPWELSICSYTKAVFKSIMFMMFFIICLGMLFTGLSAPVWVPVLGLMTGKAIQWGAVYIALFGWVVLIYVLREDLMEVAEDRGWLKGGKETEDVAPGFIAQAWKNFKEKTCIRAEVQ